MATYNKFNVFVEHLAHGKHDLETDQLVVALTATANAPVATNTVLGNLTEIAYTNLSSRNITTNTSGHTTGTYELNLTDLTLSATGTVAAFQYIVIYNDDVVIGTDGIDDALICWYDYGSSLTLNNGESLTINFDDANGLFQLT